MIIIFTISNNLSIWFVRNLEICFIELIKKYAKMINIFVKLWILFELKNIKKKKNDFVFYCSIDKYATNSEYFYGIFGSNVHIWLNHK